MKRISTSLFTFVIAIFGLAATAQADLDLPDVSQHAVVKQRVGLTDIKIDYHRPLVNGRKVWGGIVPLGEVWRAGANQNTTIEFSDDVSVEGQALPTPGGTPIDASAYRPALAARWERVDADEPRNLAILLRQRARI